MAATLINWDCSSLAWESGALRWGILMGKERSLAIILAIIADSHLRARSYAITLAIILGIAIILAIILACSARASRTPHGCHILPFRPILWNCFFPSEPAKTAQNNPKPISEGGRIWQVGPQMLRSHAINDKRWFNWY